MKVEVSFGPDATFKLNNKITVSYCLAYYKNEKVPISFLKFLLDENMQEDAEKFFDAVYQNIGISSARQKLLEAAGQLGLKRGWMLYQQFMDAAPKGQPKFYKKAAAYEPRLVITDGKQAFAFPTTLDLTQFPPNVYCQEKVIYFVINKTNFPIIKERINEFFNIAKETVSLNKKRYIIDPAKTLGLYLDDPEAARRKLETARIYNRFFTSALKCPQGYLLFFYERRGWCYGLLVTFEGKVYKFACRRRNLKEEIFHAIKEGLRLNLKPAVLTEDGRKEIAKRIGPLAPQLALLFM